MRKRTSVFWQVPREKVIEILQSSRNLREVFSHFGLRNVGSNHVTFKRRCKEDGITIPKYRRRSTHKLIPLSEVLVENSTYSRCSLKRRIIQEGLIKNECSVCGLTVEWQSKPLVLVLDHINGICDDNRLCNLRFLCPNCNSQQETFAGRNSTKPNDFGSISWVSQSTKVASERPHKRSVQLGGTRYCHSCGNKTKRSLYCPGCASKSRRKVEHPTKDELSNLLKLKPVSHIAKDYGVSDKAVAKWAIRLGIPLPGRGYWAKLGRDRNGV